MAQYGKHVTSMLHTAQQPVMVMRLLKRREDVSPSAFTQALRAAVPLSALAAFRVERWQTTHRELGSRVERGMPKSSPFDAVEVAHYRDTQQLSSNRDLDLDKLGTRAVAHIEALVVQAHYSGTWGDTSQARRIVVFPLKRRPEVTREWMQRYWRLVHGPGGRLSRARRRARGGMEGSGG